MNVILSEKIAKPANYSIFNEDFLQFRIISAEEAKQGVKKSIKAWYIVAFRGSEMDIQLNFTDPMAISPSFNRDRVTLRFMANGYFVREPDKEAIKYKYLCEAPIPPQLVVTKVIESMEKAGNMASNSMNYMLNGNLGLQIFMSVSMQLL